MNNLASGTFLQGKKYRIDKVIAQGGFSIVYTGTRVYDGVKVIIKEFFMRDYCVRKHNSVNAVVDSYQFETGKKLFKKEGDILAKLDHKYIVKLLDRFEENNTSYIVTKYAAGVSLNNYVEESTRLNLPTNMSEGRSEHIIVLIATALNYLHKQGICHLDVKPSNVFFDHKHYEGYERAEHDSVTLLDFFTARFYERDASTRMVENPSTDPIGGYTAGYSPIELMVNNAKVSPATDIYALGATWYKLLTGQMPPNPTDIINDGFTPINGVSARVNNAIEKAMAPRAKDRPQSISEFLTLLGRTLPNDSAVPAYSADDDIDVLQTFNSELPTLAIGAELQGPSYTYVIRKVLGSGSFGITYQAAVKLRGTLGMLNSEVLVCIKEFFMKGFNDRDKNGRVIGMQNAEDSIIKKYTNKFLKESLNLSRLNHKGVIRVVESFEMNGTAYYVMEYIDSGTLDDYVNSKCGMNETEAINAVKDIGDALSYMHSQKILHLDLKPKNIMRRADGSCILIDFGLSKQYTNSGSPESSTGLGAGTEGYAPLEQINYNSDKEFAPTLDVYALGATLYKMLTNRTPPSASEILNEGFPRNYLEVRGVSKPTVDAIEKAMMPMKRMRPQTIADFVGMLNTQSNPNEDVKKVIFECPDCHSRLAVADMPGLSEKSLRCPKCQHCDKVKFYIPATQAPEKKPDDNVKKVEVVCPSCYSRLLVTDQPELFEKNLRCPKCQHLDKVKFYKWPSPTYFDPESSAVEW